MNICSKQHPVLHRMDGPRGLGSRRNGDPTTIVELPQCPSYAKGNMCAASRPRQQPFTATCPAITHRPSRSRTTSRSAPIRVQVETESVRTSQSSLLVVMNSTIAWPCMQEDLLPYDEDKVIASLKRLLILLNVRETAPTLTPQNEVTGVHELSPPSHRSSYL